MAYSSWCCFLFLAFIGNFKRNFSLCLMNKHRQLLRSASCFGYSLSSLGHTEHEFVKGSPNRSLMDATGALALHRPKRSWPFVTADVTGNCASSDKTKPKSAGLSTNASTEVRKSHLVIRIDNDTTVPITDGSVQDSSGKIYSAKDAPPVSNNILVENNPARNNTLQDTCLETDVTAVDNTASQSTPISIVSSENTDSSVNQLLQSASASDSVQGVKEMISHTVSSVSTEASTIQCSTSSYFSRLTQYEDAKISDCHDSFKPRPSSNYDDYEIVNLYCKKFDKRHRKVRPQRAKRKWKKVPDEMQLDLRTSLFPRARIIINVSSVDDIEEDEIQQELELFQNALQSSEQKANIDAEIKEPCTAAISNVQELFADCEDKETLETQLDTDINKDCVGVVSSIPVNVPVQRNSSGQVTNKRLPELNSELCRVKHKLDVFRFYDCDDTENFTFYENKIPLVNLSTLESFSGLTNKKLRAKKKWKETKARIQIKTKNCRSLSNSVHGEILYIHHRVMKLMSMKLEPRTYVPPFSLNRIDAAKGIVKEIVATSSVVNTKWSPTNHSAANTSLFAMDAFNADGDLAAEVVNIMINLQHRDLLPEDYELLLRLDDRVKPKTVDVAILTQLKTEVVVGECDVLDVCAVCLDPYEVGQMKKYLPCQHYFHETCIDNWLSNSSMNCPLDGTPIIPS